MALHAPGVIRASEFGIRASDRPYFSERISELLEFIQYGSKITNLNSPEATCLELMAARRHALTPGKNMVFAARVGTRSRVSVLSEADGSKIWTPTEVANSGWVIGRHVNAISAPTEGLSLTDQLLWRFGTVTLDIVRLDPTSKNSLTSAGARLHMGSAALTLLMVERTEDVPLDRLHSLSSDEPKTAS